MNIYNTSNQPVLDIMLIYYLQFEFKLFVSLGIFTGWISFLKYLISGIIIADVHFAT